MTDQDKRASMDDSEDNRQRHGIKQVAQRLAKNAGLDWKSLSLEQRRRLKRVLRERMQSQAAHPDRQDRPLPAGMPQLTPG